MVRVNYADHNARPSWLNNLTEAIEMLGCVMMCAQELNKPVRLVGNERKVPSVWDSDRDELCSTMAKLNLPRYMVEHMGSSVAEVVYTIQCVQESNRSKAAVLAMGLNIDKIVKLNENRKYAIIAWMNSQGREVLDWKASILCDLMHRRWFGKSLRSEKMKEINMFVHTSGKCGGLGSWTEDRKTYQTNGAISKNNHFDHKRLSRAEVTKKHKNKLVGTLSGGLDDMVRSMEMGLEEKDYKLADKWFGTINPLMAGLVEDLGRRTLWRYGKSQTEDKVQGWLHSLVRLG